MGADRDMSAFVRILQLLRQEKVSGGSRIEELYLYLFENKYFPGRKFQLSALGEWTIDELRRALDISEEIIAQYTRHFCDLSEIPVTYYKRERRVRRHLDQQFSGLFKELMFRAGRLSDPELITEEPIYYLSQQAREKRFPKSKDGRASLSILRSRFHLELSHRVETGPDSRRVLLPHEIR